MNLNLDGQPGTLSEEGQSWSRLRGFLLTQLKVGTSRLAANSLLRNSVYVIATTVVTSLLGAVYWAAAARTYSARDVGLASATVSAMLLTARFANLGIGSVYVQMLPRRASGRNWSLTLNAGLLAGTGAGLVSGLALAALLPLLSAAFRVSGDARLYAAVLVVGVALFTVSIILDQSFVAERAAGNQLARNAAFAVLKIPLLLIPLVVGAADATAIVSSWVLASGLTVAGAFLILIPRLGRGYTLVVRGAAREMRSMLSFMAGHHAITLAGMAPSYLLPVLVASRLTPADNAYFYTAWMVGSVFFIVSPAVSLSLFAEGAFDPGALRSRVRSSALIIAALLGPLMLGTLVFGRWVLAVFGSSYSTHGWLLLSILVISAVPDAFTNVAVSVLRVQRLLGHATALNLGMAVCKLGLTWVLLPPLGIAGAGWAFLCAQLLGTIAVGLWMLLARRGAGPPLPPGTPAREGRSLVADGPPADGP